MSRSLACAFATALALVFAARASAAFPTENLAATATNRASQGRDLS